MGKRIVILGAGTGGLVAANEVRRLLPSDHEVVTVERAETHAFAPSFLWVMTGDRRPEEVRRPLKDLLRPGIEVVAEEVVAIEPKRREVVTRSRRIAFDYLVVALGAELDLTGPDGLPPAAHHFYTLEGAARLRGALDRFPGGTVALVVLGVPYKCPGAPAEGALLMRDRLAARRVPFDLAVFTPEPQPLPVAGPELGGAVRSLLEGRGIRYFAGQELEKATETPRELVFKSGLVQPYDLLVVVPRHRAPAVVRNSSLAGAAGWIPVDPETLRVPGYDDVYAIGDVTTIPLPGRWQPETPLSLPKAGVFAHSQGLAVARAIAARLGVGAADAGGRGYGYCMLEVGDGRAAFAAGDFFALPAPNVRFRPPSPIWHWGKVLLERYWLRPARRRFWHRVALKAGSKLLGVRAEV